ncbi:hypothetical protein NLB33_04275 [Mycolicibacterium smegmatis]|uniref:hypothetical protein n=1 Tax=Mycolicibacterium smegmatis TaxID=1772 RepID=UPI0020A3DCF3|nr:hypothetical protein [Mycolicibacterium smegmatis]MCP2622069.1 hypothetical protein [Mycolicibacterium smegmatis]
METKDWPEQSAALYRRVAQECAREQPHTTTATVVFAGFYAEAKQRWRIGTVEAQNEAEARLELLCGDLLATRAGGELHIRDVLGVGGWLDTNWMYVESRVNSLLQVQELADPSATVGVAAERYYAASAMESLAAAPDSTTAAMAWAGAVATSRMRLGDSWYSLSAGDRDAHLAEVVCGDPVWAAAGEELDDDHCRYAACWVHERWDDICAAAEELAALTAAAVTPVTVEQRIAIARHEVRNGMLHGLRNPSEEGGAHEQARAAVILYTEAAAEALVRWETVGGSPESADEAMRLHAEDASAAVDAQAWITPAARDKLREAVRDRWTQLAPPLRAR